MSHNTYRHFVENPLPSACARAVVLGLPNENISTLAKLCAMITSAEGVSHDKVAKVWGKSSIGCVLHSYLKGSQ